MKALKAQMSSHLVVMAPKASTRVRRHALRSSCITVQELNNAPCMGHQWDGMAILNIRGEAMSKKVSHP
jgi:hypothetical protein